MRPPEMLSSLASSLERQGVAVARTRGELKGDGADWRVVWTTFCALAREPCDAPFERGGETLRVTGVADGDLLLHESGLLGADGGPFGIYLTRQLTFADAAGEYAGMNALTVTIACDRIPEGRVPQAQRWGSAGRGAGDVEAWAAAVEGSNSFRLLEALGPAGWDAAQSDV